MPIQILEQKPTELQKNPNFASEFLSSGCFFAVDSERILLGWGAWQRSKVPRDHGCSLYTPDFYLQDELPWRSPSQFEVVNRDFFTSTVLSKLRAEVNSQFPERDPEHAPERDLRFQWLEPDLKEFESQVQKIRLHFANGQLEKAVPVSHSKAQEFMTLDRMVNILEKLALAPPSLIPSGFWADTEGLLGATPERLFTLEASGRLTTMALAGTRARTTSQDAQKLLDDPKERHEHQLVIDDLKARLSAYGIVHVGDTFVVELPTLYHLKAVISVEGVSASFEDLARTLHPTPALGVAPRSFGLQKMREWDDIDLRHRFGAPFGLFLRTPEFNIRDCLVAIRNVQWSNAQPPTLGAGCGFVKQSKVENEWAELKLKRDSVKKVLSV